MKVDWSVVFWISVIVVFLWLLARAVGLIRTSIWIEVIPYAGGFFALLAIVKELGKYAQKFEMVVLDVSEMKGDLRVMRQDIHNLDKRVAILETRIG